MNGKFFLDTNIFVYSFDGSAPAKARTATRLIQEAVASGKGVTSYQVVQEFFNVALRRFAQPMTAAEAEQYLRTVFRPLTAIHSSHALYAQALRVSERHRLHWYDALIVAAAIEGRCSVLFSEDMQHGRSFEHLRIENPFA